MNANLPKLGGNVINWSKRLIGVEILCRSCAQGMETIAMQYSVILAIDRIVIVTINVTEYT